MRRCPGDDATVRLAGRLARPLLTASPPCPLARPHQQRGSTQLRSYYFWLETDS